MSVTAPDETLAALNSVLSEVIDIVREAKRSRWLASSQPALQAEFDLLFDDARSWAQLLIDRDEAHGVSPLVSMATPAERTPPTFTPDGPGADTREVLMHHLEQLDEHIAAALQQPQDDDVRHALEQVERAVTGHREALGV
jgi:hypothetical protein